MKKMGDKRLESKENKIRKNNLVIQELKDYSRLLLNCKNTLLSISDIV